MCFRRWREVIDVACFSCNLVELHNVFREWKCDEIINWKLSDQKHLWNRQWKWQVWRLLLCLFYEQSRVYNIQILRSEAVVFMHKWLPFCRSTLKVDKLFFCANRTFEMIEGYSCKEGHNMHEKDCTTVKLLSKGFLFLLGMQCICCD